jgi:hypothetical protein
MSDEDKPDVGRLTGLGWTWAIPAITILGVGASLIYVSQVPSAVRWIVFATASGIAATAFLIGGIVGLLFGIPRTVQGSAPSTEDRRYEGNTNLEQISDWLTKIIVGIGLVQIGRVLPALTKLSESLKEPLGAQPSSSTFGLTLTISYTLLGFLYFYLWSRTLFELQLRRILSRLSRRTSS